YSAMMSAVSGIRADSITSTVTRQPSPRGSTPVTDSGVLVVSTCNCLRAATAALRADSLGLAGRCFFVFVAERSVDSDDRSALLRCGRFCVVFSPSLDELGRLVRDVFSSDSLACCSVIVCYLLISKRFRSGPSYCPNLSAGSGSKL